MADANEWNDSRVLHELLICSALARVVQSTLMHEPEAGAQTAMLLADDLATRLPVLRDVVEGLFLRQSHEAARQST